MKRVLLIAGLAGLVASSQAVNLISDGGFEIGDSYSPQFTGTPWTTQYGYATNNVASTSNTGSIWHEGNMRVMDGVAANNSGTGHTSWNPVTAYEGSAFLAVNGATNTTNQPFVLEQDFSYSGTGPLSVSFSFINLYSPGGQAGASDIQVFLDGNLLGTVNTWDAAQSSTNNPWHSSSFSASVANTGSHTLRIIAPTTQASGNDFGLDDISVTAPVPEPATMALGFAAVGAAIRRRLKAKRA